MTTVKPMTRLRKMLDRFHAESGIIDDVAKSIESMDGAILLVAAMYDLQQDVRAMLSVAESRLIDLTPKDKRYGPPIPIPGGGSVEFHGGPNSEVVRYKDNRRVLGKFSYEIGRDVLSDLEITRIVTANGEDLYMNADMIVMRIAEKIAEATGALTDGFKGWRTGVAKAYGIDLRGFRESTDAPVTVTIRGRSRT